MWIKQTPQKQRINAKQYYCTLRSWRRARAKNNSCCELFHRRRSARDWRVAVTWRARGDIYCAITSLFLEWGWMWRLVNLNLWCVLSVYNSIFLLNSMNPEKHYTRHQNKASTFVRLSGLIISCYHNCDE